MLPLSHDEVVHGKGALMDRMPGDEWKRFANLRLMYAYMFTGRASQWKGTGSTGPRGKVIQRNPIGPASQAKVARS